MNPYAEYRNQQSVTDVLHRIRAKREKKEEKQRRDKLVKNIIRRNNIEANKRFFATYSFLPILLAFALGIVVCLVIFRTL